MNKKRLGSNFDAFLREEQLLDQAQATAYQRRRIANPPRAFGQHRLTPQSAVQPQARVGREVERAGGAPRSPASPVRIGQFDIRTIFGTIRTWKMMPTNPH